MPIQTQFPASFAKKGIHYLLRDTFPTDKASPLTSPRIAEPGPGTLIFNNPDRFRIADGKLIVDPGQPSGIHAFCAGFTPQPDVVVFWEGNQSNSESPLGIHNVGVPQGNYGMLRIGMRTNHNHYMREYTFSVPFSWAFPVVAQGNERADKIAILLDSDQRPWVYTTNNTTGEWELFWIGVKTIPGNTLYANWGVQTDGAAHPTWGGSLGSIRALVLPGVKQTTLDMSQTISDVEYLGVADGIFDLEFTAPDPLVGSLELRYRMADNDNFTRIRIDDSGAVLMETVANGISTTRYGDAGKVAAGQHRILRICTRGNRHNYGLIDTSVSAVVFSPGGSAFRTVSHFDAQQMLMPVVDGGWVLGKMACYPRYAPAYGLLDLSGQPSSSPATEGGLLSAATLDGGGVYA